MKVLVLLLAVSLVSFAAYATDTSRGEYTTPNPYVTDWLNSNDSLYHSHSYNNSRYDNPAGLGLDMTLYEFEGTPRNVGLESVDLEQRYDFSNKAYTVYGVLKLNAWQALKSGFAALRR